ncbi:leucine-rich repeat-containing protein 42 isoform X4 [Ambystoma mexicanum]|uniref:leucine-rich repeat-containing protein 42 isoform X4 n=1 Tax=Ambystoma mexicanum TaxID=8296 RepID=UPI0037E7404B
MGHIKGTWCILTEQRLLLLFPAALYDALINTASTGKQNIRARSIRQASRACDSSFPTPEAEQKQWEPPGEGADRWHLVVSEKLEDIKSFQQLTSLDLSFCKLGDGHELLEHLTTEPLSSLIQLYLRDNGLSDAGIRKMTAPVRVMKRGLPNLQVFDLSCNPNITERGVAFLFGFRKLNCLDVSETGVQDKKAVRQKIMDNLGLVYAEDPLKEFDHLSCKTQGWAEQVVRQWDQAISEAVKPKDSLKYRTAARNFYGKVKRFYPEETPAFVDAITCGRLQFYSKVTGLTHTPLLVKESADFKDAETENTKKRTHDSQSKEEDNSSNTVKRKCTHFSLEDWDLIKTY